MTTRFRAGDVISNTAWPGEYQVTDVGEHIVWADGIAPAGGGVSIAVERCTLLRRPLRVGDVSVHAASTARWTLTLDAEVARNHWRKAGWTHEDGTPIDVEAPTVEAKAYCAGCKGEGTHSCPGSNAAKAAQEMSGQYLNTLNAFQDAKQAQLVTQMQSKRASTMNAIVTEAKKMAGALATGQADHAMRDKYEDAVRQSRENAQRANRLSDECGALASQNRELLVENAQLRRENERLTRKARR